MFGPVFRLGKYQCFRCGFEELKDSQDRARIHLCTGMYENVCCGSMWPLWYVLVTLFHNMVVSMQHPRIWRWF